ncbi:MAG TPA: FtsW/RodA/SpoVE family cell cycle protein [Candidatus Cloacimonadota bacterium]|nr:rod shape-determining protein RodA [Candidatus Cloacimonadota bacterium]HOD54562.1 FtsW/RodA/SpoVE family cell cycle protein [Candidatus Cloacimonadota bacterium]HPM01607.1 FtsW/RodA/SpoVE family cell cycle protein [Candidatus Cloacimonadota bacterium]
MKFNFDRNFDWYLFTVWMALVVFGIIAIFTASASKIGEEMVLKNHYWKQIIWFVLSLGLFIFIMKVPLPVIDMFIWPLYGLTLILLIIVLFMPPVNNSRSWLMLGGFRFQPSELAKIVMILLISKLISKEHISEYKMLTKAISGTILPVFLILLEPDFGTTLVFWGSLVLMLAQAGFPLSYIVVLISPITGIIFSLNWMLFVFVCFLLILYYYREHFNWVLISFSIIFNTFIFLLTPVFWNSLKEYQQNRIITFFNPMHDPLGAGYQVIQAKIAIGSGQLFGKGFLQGSQKNMNFLPEHHTDFIFSVVGEEFGFMGASLLLVLFFLFFNRIIYLIRVVSKREYKIAISGIFGYLLLQTFINIGMNLGVLPTTGIPLPFISYGGSNLLINSFAIAMILKYSVYKVV